MKSLVRVGSVVWVAAAAAAFAGCGADGFKDSTDGVEGDIASSDAVSSSQVSSEGSDEGDYGTAAEALMSCSNPDGTNSVMAAFAVAVAQELGRWNTSKDFVMNLTSGWSESSYGAQQAIKLASGSDASGPIGKSRCADGKCARVQALLDMQYDQANNKVYIQGSGTTKVLLSPSALRSRMYAKWGEQKTCDASPRNGDSTACTTEKHVLKYSSSAVGGCDLNVTFAANNTSGGALLYTNQLKNELKFADATNPYINFTNLGNGYVSIDPTYGLDDIGTSTTATCTAACTKISMTDVSGQCCSCSGVTKAFGKSAWSAITYLCQ
jgi:hypothetical protein